MSFNPDTPANKSFQTSSAGIVAYTAAQQLAPSQVTHLNADLLAHAAQLRQEEAVLRQHAVAQQMQEYQTAFLSTQAQQPPMPPFPPNTYPGYNNTQQLSSFYNNNNAQQHCSPVTGAPYNNNNNTNFYNTATVNHNFGMTPVAPMPMMGSVGF
jgi:hypothetical protein